jgi:hypothetical protein
LRNISPVARIIETVVLLKEAAQSLIVPAVPAMHPAHLAHAGPWDEEDMAAAEEPFDSIADEIEDQWAAAFEAAASMGLETDV